MSVIETDLAPVQTDSDDGIEHVVCCLDLAGTGPALCGTDVTGMPWSDRATPIDCVVCNDLADIADWCPTGNTCPVWNP